jgi:SAM-dependent methyltransferase
MPRDDPRHAAVLARALRHGSRALYDDPATYDALYRRRRLDVPFYVDLARQSGGPVLELGVGSARIAAAIASAGIDVVGVDVLPSMLARAKERIAALPRSVRGRVTLVRGDLRTLALRRRFPLVIAPFNALLHLYDARALCSALRVARRHLAPRGRLAFDVVMPDVTRLAQDPERSYAAGHLTVPEHGTRYRVREASHYDAARQIHTTVFVLDPVRGPGAARAVPLTHRQIFPAELPLLLRAAGLSLERHDGDFDRGALSDECEYQVVIARAAR